MREWLENRAWTCASTGPPVSERSRGYLGVETACIRARAFSLASLTADGSGAGLVNSMLNALSNTASAEAPDISCERRILPYRRLDPTDEPRNSAARPTSGFTHGVKRRDPRGRFSGGVPESQCGPRASFGATRRDVGPLAVRPTERVVRCPEHERREQLLPEAIPREGARLPDQAPDDVAVVDTGAPQSPATAASCTAPGRRRGPRPSTDADGPRPCDRSAATAPSRTRPPTRIVLHFRTTHRKVVYSGIRAGGSDRRYGRSSASRGAARAFRVSSTTARANRRYAASSAKSRSPRNSNGLLDGRLRPEVRLLRDAVLVRLPRLDPRRAQPVVVQHLPEPHRQLTTAAAPQLVRRRRQVVVTKHRRNRAQRPQRALEPRHQGLERLAPRQRHIRPPAVAQHPLEQQMRERHAPQRHPQVARVAEVERRFPARNRHLLEVHLAIGAVLNPPLSDSRCNVRSCPGWNRPG